MTRKHDGRWRAKENRGSLTRHAQLARRAGHPRYLAKDLDVTRELISKPTAADAKHKRNHNATY